MEKIKVWKCEACKVEDAPCLAVNMCGCLGSIFSTAPVSCIAFRKNTEANWQPTDEYEIVKKDQDIHAANLPDEFKIKKFKSKKEMEDFMMKKIEPLAAELKPKVPNCAICKWRTGHPPVNIKNFDQLNAVCSGLHLCSSQADKHVGEVYNTDECKLCLNRRKRSRS